MGTVSVSTTPVQLDDGSHPRIYVGNTGLVRATLTTAHGPEVFDPGFSRHVDTGGVAVTAKTALGSTTLTVDTTNAAPIPGVDDAELEAAIEAAVADLVLGDAAALDVGTASGTVAAGNDSRIVGAAQKSANLSDLGSAATARTNLGLAAGATAAIGTGAGTVAAGDDSRITGAAQKAANLSDVGSTSTARTNLGLGTAATMTPATLATDSALTGAFAAKGRLSPAIYDVFNRYADGAAAGLTPVLGGAWSTTGANPTVISGGAATSAGTGYLWQTLARQPAEMWCEMSWSGSDATIAAQTMAMSADAPLSLANLLHLNFSATGFNCTLRANSGTFDGFGLYGNWRKPMKLDGTKYVIRFAVIGETAIVVGPNGEVYAATDPRVRTIGGPTVFWEPGSIVQMYSCGASMGDASGNLATHVGPSYLGAAGQLVDHYGRTAGQRDDFGMVSLGGHPSQSGFPAIAFGPEFIAGTVRTAVSSGSSLILDRRMPAGTVIQIGSTSATDGESVTTSGFPTGTGPFTHTLTGSISKAHSVGDPAIGVVPSAGRRYMWFNYINDAVYLDAGALAVTGAAGVFLGSGSDASVKRVAAATVSVGKLAVTNSATATTPGTVTRKVEIFDGNGNSLGFIPVYNAIT